MNVPPASSFVQVWVLLTCATLIGLLAIGQHHAQEELQVSRRQLRELRKELEVVNGKLSEVVRERDAARKDARDVSQGYERELERAKQSWAREGYLAAVSANKCLDEEIDLRPRGGGALVSYLNNLQEKCFAERGTPKFMSQGSTLPRVVAVDATSSRRVKMSFDSGEGSHGRTSIRTHFNDKLTHSECCAAKGFPLRSFHLGRPGVYLHCVPGSTISPAIWEEAESRGVGCRNSKSFAAK